MAPSSRRDFLGTSIVAGLATGWHWSPPPVQGATPAKIRIGQIGTGHGHASGKMAVMRASDEYEVVGIVEPNPQLRAEAQKRPVYADLRWMTEEQLLNTPGLQAVAIETEVKDLVPTGTRCVAAGKHIHLEKPAGESLSAFKQLLDEAARQKVVVQMGYMFRSNPAFVFCYQLLRDGWLGEIFAIDAVMSKASPKAERDAMLPYPGGAMFEIGCHVIDAIVQILGRPTKVTAHNRSSSQRVDGLADNQFAVLDYPKAIATVRASIIEHGGNARRQFVVCGTQGTFEIHPLETPRAKLTLATARGPYSKGSQEVPFARPESRYGGDFVDFARAIRGEKPLDFTPEHDLWTEETILLASGLPLN